MNHWNWLTRPLGFALAYSVLLVGQRVALAQPAPTPKGPDAAPAVNSTAPAQPAPAAGSAEGSGDVTFPSAAPAEPAPSAAPAAAPPPPPPASEPPTPPAPTAKKDRVRFEIGGRVGYGIPLGDLSSASTLKNVFDASIPGVLDVWARLPRGLALGAYFGLAAGISGHALDTCNDCTALNYRLGLQAARHFFDGGIVDPWVGVGLGFEWASITQRQTVQGYDVTWDSTYTALPEITAQAGIDIGGDTVAFGPYVSISYAAFNKVKSTVSCSNIDCNDGVSSSADVDGGGHGWLTIGLRGTYMR